VFSFLTCKQFLEPNRWPASDSRDGTVGPNWSLILVTVQSVPINDDHRDSTASERKYCGMPTCRRTLRLSTINHITSEFGVKTLFHSSWKSSAAGCYGRQRLPSLRSSCLSSVSPSKPFYVSTNFYFLIILLLDPTQLVYLAGSPASTANKHENSRENETSGITESGRNRQANSSAVRSHLERAAIHTDCHYCGTANNK
jgi:hypothetical protein